MGYVGPPTYHCTPTRVNVGQTECPKAEARPPETTELSEFICVNPISTNISEMGKHEWMHMHYISQGARVLIMTYVWGMNAVSGAM